VTEDAALTGADSKPGRLNATAAALLGFLHAGEQSGYELAGTAQRVIGDFWTVTRSQVYRELAALAGRGLVEEGERGARSRRPYQITPAGRTAFADWIARPPGTEQIRYPLLLTMSFGPWLGPERLLDLVAEHRCLHEDRLARYLGVAAERADELGPYHMVTLTFGIHYERAVLAWMDDVPQLLAGARAGSPGEAGH
jgi:DNA-binding PadR family transcriptional regulator